MFWLGLLLMVAVIGLAITAIKARTASTTLQRTSAELSQLEQRYGELAEQYQLLSKYRTVVDAEARAAEIIAEAEQTASEHQAKAESEANSLRQKANTLLADATQESQRIVDNATRRAEEIAGEAFAAMQNAKQLEQTAKAMKNVINGYGDQYLIPTFGLLDDLADDFGFAEAGIRLKAARTRMRQMIKDGIAAACDYVEANRKSTAIDFVLDAFNGKVESILSGVRKDNYGTLEQKIKDAYSVVNHNGQAFRNARITPEYLETRIEELRWAVMATELKNKEREEQRAIKERMREEEKARREYERAQKEAQKEEKMLQKALEKVQLQFDKAGDEQKAKYEAELMELREQLRLAEEKNQRAISMAQQTKAGHVYIISNIGSFGENIYKIGMTRRLEPLDRVRELGDASVPFDFDVHALINSKDAPSLERAIHKCFLRQQVNKINPRKEFFRVTIQEIRQEVERMGLHAHWTMTAECRDYQETLAIERAMQTQSFAEEEWAERQVREHDAVMDEELNEAIA